MAREKVILTEALGGLRMRDTVQVSPGTSVMDVVRAMREGRATSAIVMKGRDLLGIVTERDVLLKCFPAEKGGALPVDKVMTPNPGCLHSTDTLEKAIHLMNEKNYRHIPIRDKDETILGVLTIQDVIQCISEHFPNEVYNLPPVLHQRHSKVEGG